jgi:hypothetical protein
MGAMYWIAQGIGFIAFIAALWVFQRNKRKEMLYIKVASALLFAIHFLFLGGMTGFAVEIVGATRSYIFAHRTEKKWAKSSLWLYGFIAAFLIAGLLTWEGYYSSFAVMGMIAGTISFWLKNPKHIRLFSLIAPPLWMLYSIIKGSIPGVAQEMFVLISVLVGITRFDILHQKQVRAHG